jgi:hypothetical protein
MTAPSKQSHRKASSISEQKKVFDAQWIRFFAGGLASATAEIFTLPIDCIKVRLQAWRSATKSTIPIHMINYATLKTKTISALDVPYKGMMDVASKIISEEGPTALWKGSTPALMRQISYTSSCMVLYEPFRDFFRTNVGNRSEIPFINKFLAGGCAGAIGISIANP